MHPTLTKIQESLEKIVNQIPTVMGNDEPLCIAHNNFGFTGLTRSELIGEAQSIINQIKDHETDNIGGGDARLNDYVRRLQFIQQQTIPNLWNGNAGVAVSAYLWTLNGLRKALEPVLDRDRVAEAAQAAAILRELTTKLRGLESQVRSLEPRTVSLTSMVTRIEQAYNAADKLPMDLESLSEAREKMAGLVKMATDDIGRISKIESQSNEIKEKLSIRATEAESVLERCETAYSAATSVGLAAAFAERSSSLAKSMWIWVVGLLFALVAGGVVGSVRLQGLTDLMKTSSFSSSEVFFNMTLSLLSVGAPIWFAWLATKQIGQRFRLSEDYAFKASISRAYEGFRREAARVDKELEAQLLASALTRLDELPLRLVEADNHGSPWHEFASSDLVRQAIRTVPDFADQVKELAKRAIDIAARSTDKSLARSAEKKETES